MRYGWVLIAALCACGRLGFDPLDPALTGDAAQGRDSSTPDASLVCPPSYLSVNGRCFRGVFGAQLPWMQAEAACEADAAGAHLAVIDHAGELPELGDTFAELAGDSAWIGVSELVTDGTYLAVTGGPAFLAWRSGDPSNGSEECVALLDGRMNDLDCPFADDYICEYDGIPADPSAF